MSCQIALMFHMAAMGRYQELAPRKRVAGVKLERPLGRGNAPIEKPAAGSDRRRSVFLRQLMRQKAELEETLARIKRLEGLLSIGMYCKKIRAENND